MKRHCFFCHTEDEDMFDRESRTICAKCAKRNSGMLRDNGPYQAYRRSFLTETRPSTPKEKPINCWPFGRIKPRKFSYADL